MIKDAQHDGRSMPDVMFQLITGYWISQAVGAVALLGVPDQLTSGPRGSDDLARAVGAHPQALFRVLRTLASIGVFSQPEPGVFALTPLGETLRSDAPGSVRNFAIAQTAHGHWQPWGRFVESVRTGLPMAREALGVELWQWYGAHPQDAAFFSAAMGDLAVLAAGELVRVYDVTTARTIVDVGGAHGVLLATALHANPNAHGILFDLPHVIDTAALAIEAQGLTDRVTLAAGDFFESVPDGADLHILKQIVHDWDDERAARILANCHRALAPGGKMLLVEMVVPPDNHASGVQPMDLHMMVMLGGRERTEAEFGSLLGGVGFRMERIIPTHSPFSIVEATRR